MRTTRSVSGWAVVLLLLLGGWQAGHGAWIHAKAQLAQYLLQRAWTRTLEGERDARPWPWADTWPVARLRVPAHGVDLIVLDGVSGRTLAFAPGHASGSPVPGEMGTSVISGHRDTHFRFLAALKPDDEIVVEVPGRPAARFRVMDAAVVDSRMAVIRIADGPALALLTCYPFSALRAGGPLRWVVTARPSTS
jgi:sortase A